MQVPNATQTRCESGTEDLAKTKAYSTFQKESRNHPTGASKETVERVKKQEKHAKVYYEEIRNRNTNSVVNKISKNGGISKKAAKRVYDHVFIEKHLFEDGRNERFFEDYDMAESFRRILLGKPFKHDIILLKHESLENYIMTRYNLMYEDAHSIAEKKYNYRLALDEFRKSVLK